MKILVTGAGGFVGRAVIRHLTAHGHRVVGWVRGDVDLTDSAAVRAAVRDEDTVDAVVHLAARSKIRESWADPAEVYAVNVGGTAALLRALRDRPTRWVFASTSTVYGAKQSGALSERLQPRPGDPYSASKVAAEDLLRFHATTGAVGVTTLRLFNVAGALDGITDPDRTRIISNCLRAAAGEIPHMTVNGDGSARREFTHVADVAEAVRLALAATLVGAARTYNIGTGAGVSVMEVVEAARKATGVQFDVVHNPPVPEPDVLVADVSLAAAELGWRPSRSTLEQVLEDAWRHRAA